MTSLAVMFGTGSTVIVPYVYFSMLTGKGETGKASVIVNGDASNGAGNNAGISVTVSGVEKPKEYTYSATCVSHKHVPVHLPGRGFFMP